MHFYLEVDFCRTIVSGMTASDWVDFNRETELSSRLWTKNTLYKYSYDHENSKICKQKVLSEECDKKSPYWLTLTHSYAKKVLIDTHLRYVMLRRIRQVSLPFTVQLGKSYPLRYAILIFDADIQWCKVSRATQLGRAQRGVYSVFIPNIGWVLLS